MANIPLESVKPIENKEQEIVKFKENTLSQSTNNNNIKEPLISTKFTRPSKFVIINNNINNIILRKKNSLFDNKTVRKKDRSSVKFNEEIIEEEEKKRKNKPRKSFIRNAKNTVKISNKDFNKLRIFSDYYS